MEKKAALQVPMDGTEIEISDVLFSTPLGNFTT